MAQTKLPIARPDTIRRAIVAAEESGKAYSCRLKNYVSVKDLQEVNQRCIQRLKQLRN